MDSSEKLIKQIADLSRNLESLVGEMRETNKQIKSSTQGLKDSAESNKKLAEATTKATTQKETPAPSKKEESKEDSGGTSYEDLVKLFEQSFAESKPLKNETAKDQKLKIPFLAEGGEITKSGAAVVGEKGPEVVKLNKGDEVIPSGDPVKTLTSLIEAWESKNKDGGSIFQQDGKLLQELIKTATGGKGGIGTIVPSKEQIDEKVKELLTGKDSSKFLGNPAGLESEIYNFVKEKYGPYGLKLFLNPGRLGDEGFKGKFDLPVTSEDLQGLYDKVNKKEEPSAKQITETPKLEEVEKVPQEAKEESGEGGEKKQSKLGKIFGKVKETGKKILGSKVAGEAAKAIGGEKYGSLISGGMSLLQGKKPEGEEVEEEDSSEKKSEDFLGKITEGLSKGTSETPKETPEGQISEENMALLEKTATQVESGDLSSVEVSSLVSALPEISKAAPGLIQNPPGSTPQSPGGSQDASTPGQPQSSESSPESSPGSSQSGAKPQAPAAGSSAPPQITSQDIQEIKGLLAAINSTLSGPLRVKNNKPSRPESSML